MKALILAAGLGTRLRPLTEHTPKTLVEIGGRPLLSYHLAGLSSHGVTEVLINTHHLSLKVEEFIGQYLKANPDMKVSISHEKTLLGSAGTLEANRNFFNQEDNFLVVYGDNLTNINYTRLAQYHKNKNGLATIACYKESFPETKGIVQFDQDRKIKYFVEKPKASLALGNWANAGAYVLNKKILDYLDSNAGLPLDFGLHIFPQLVEANVPMYVYEMEEYILDIGTPESYAQAQEAIKHLVI